MKHFLLSLLLFFSATILFSQTVYNNFYGSYPTFTNKNVKLTGRGMLTITGNSNPLSGSTVDLASEDVWVYFPNMRPSAVVNTEISRIKVNGATATVGTNIRVSIYMEGTMVIPHSSTYNALTVYADDNLKGTSKTLAVSAHYKSTELGTMDNNIQSFRLKKGYMATFASNEDGTGASRVFIASEGDVVVSAMPSNLSNAVSLVVVRRWNWTSKKSWRGSATEAISFGCTSNYDYNNSASSTIDVEYVPMRHNPNWNVYANFYGKYDCTHALGFNEPDNSVDDGYATVETALSQWPRMLESGLRVGTPACTDGGLNWLYSFIDQCDNLGYRVDFVAWHFYRRGYTAQSLYNTLKAIHDRTGRPIWITEFNNGCNWTYDANNPVPSTTTNGTIISSFINMMDTTSFIERYFVWNGCNENLRMTNSGTGALYPAGIAYRDKISAIAYTKDYYTNDMGSSVVAGTVQIRNRAQSMLLDSYGSTTNGDPVKQYSISSTHNNTKWDLVPVASSYGSIYFYIKNMGTGLVIDGYGRTANGSDAAMYANTTTHVNSQWKFEAIKGQYYRIKNRGTGLYLDGVGTTTNGASCKQYGNTLHVNAQWELVSTNSLTLKSGSEKRSMDESADEDCLVNIYPSPAKNNIYVSVGNSFVSGCTISIFNNVGKCVKVKANVTSEIENVDISNLKSGIYILKVKQNDRVLTGKFVIE